MIQNFPCRLLSYSTVKPGKNGGRKAFYSGRDIFTDRMYEECLKSWSYDVPHVFQYEMQCIGISDDGFLQLMDNDCEVNENIKLPTENHLRDLAESIKITLETSEKECLVTVQKWGDKE